MIARDFRPSDLLTFDEWLDKRGLPISSEVLPKRGLVILNRREPIAIGFLRLCEGAYAILDTIITDPSASPSDRNSALDVLFDTAVIEAKELQLMGLIGFSVDENTGLRAERHGFTRQPFVLFTRKV